MKHLAPTLGQRLDRLVAFYHPRGEDELTNQAVATLAGQKLGQPVSVELIEQAREGEIDALPADVANALCDSFGVDRDYLRSTGDKDAGIDIDQRLRLWIAIRDRGLNHFAARALDLNREDFEKLIEEVNSFPLSTGT